MHIVVIDANGLFTGTRGTVLETYAFVSKASNASINGVSNYYKNVVFNQSAYVYAIDPVSYSSTNSTWGRTIESATTFALLSGVQNVVLASGVDSTPAEGDIKSGFDDWSGVPKFVSEIDTTNWEIFNLFNFGIIKNKPSSTGLTLIRKR